MNEEKNMSVNNNNNENTGSTLTSSTNETVSNLEVKITDTNTVVVPGTTPTAQTTTDVPQEISTPTIESQTSKVLENQSSVVRQEPIVTEQAATTSTQEITQAKVEATPQQVTENSNITSVTEQTVQNQATIPSSQGLPSTSTEQTVPNTIESQNITKVEEPIPQTSIPNQQEKILSTPTEITNQNINNDNIEEKKPKKKSKIPLLLIFIILIAGGLYLFYNYYLMNEEVILKNETKKAFAFIKEKINLAEKNTFNYDIEKEALGIEGKLTVSSNYKSEELDLEKLSNYNITYNGAIDKSNNKLSGSIALNKNNDKVLSSDMYMQEKELLIKLNELFDKALKKTSETEIKDLETTKSLSYDNIKTIINKTEEITLNAIDKEQLSKKLVQKEINNKKDYYMEVTYKLNTKKYTINLIDGYSKDEEIIKILAELTNQTNDDIKKLLEDYKKSIEESTSEDTILDIVFYMDKITSSFKEVDIISKEKDYENKEIINKYIINKTNNIYSLEYNNNGKTDTTGTYDLSKKELTITTKNEDNSTSITVTEVNDNTISISFNTASKDSYNISVVAKINNQITSTSQTTNTLITINYKQGEQNINAEVNNNITMTKGKAPEELKDDDSIDVESLTEEQINEMKQKATNIMESVLKDFIIDQTKVPDLNQSL